MRFVIIGMGDCPTSAKGIRDSLATVMNSGRVDAMSEAFQPTKRKCDVCGRPLDEGPNQGFRVLEVSYHVIETIRKVDEDLADELLQNDGRLTYHDGCTHPVQQYLPEQSQAVLVSEQEERDPSRDIVECSVCGIPVLESIGQCGRCGKEIE